MIESQLVVLTNAVEGRDEDFNDWYSNIHARDTMRMPGGLAQQRFAFSADQVQDFGGDFPAKYLAIYDVYDTKAFTQAHIDWAGTPLLVVEDSLDMRRLDDFFYFPLQFRDKKPRTASKCSVVLEQMQVKAGEEEAFRSWYGDSYMAERFGQAGIVAGSFLGFEDYGQMMPFPPTHNHVAIWRVEDDAARNRWRESNPLAGCPHLEEDTLAISCWDIASQRLIKDQVTYPESSALAKEEAARARIAKQDSCIKVGERRIKG